MRLFPWKPGQITTTPVETSFWRVVHIEVGYWICSLLEPGPQLRRTVKPGRCVSVQLAVLCGGGGKGCVELMIPRCAWSEGPVELTLPSWGGCQRSAELLVITCGWSEGSDCG